MAAASERFSLLLSATPESCPTFVFEQGCFFSSCISHAVSSFMLFVTPGYLCHTVSHRGCCHSQSHLGTCPMLPLSLSLTRRLVDDSGNRFLVPLLFVTQTILSFCCLSHPVFLSPFYSSYVVPKLSISPDVFFPILSIASLPSVTPIHKRFTHAVYLSCSMLSVTPVVLSHCCLSHPVHCPMLSAISYPLLCTYAVFYHAK